VGSVGRDGEESIVENVQVTNCTFIRTDNGARIKTWPVIKNLNSFSILKLDLL